MLPLQLLLEQRGDRRVLDVVAGLWCSACRGKAGPVYLAAGQTRMFSFGPPPSWSLEPAASPQP